MACVFAMGQALINVIVLIILYMACHRGWPGQPFVPAPNPLGLARPVRTPAAPVYPPGCPAPTFMPRDSGGHTHDHHHAVPRGHAYHHVCFHRGQVMCSAVPNIILKYVLLAMLCWSGQSKSHFKSSTQLSRLPIYQYAGSTPTLRPA